MGDQEVDKARVLVVDDEPDIQRLVTFNLERAGFEVRAAASGAEAIAIAAEFSPQVVVLDLMLPDVPGVSICRQLRADPAHARTGILMLTARGDEYDRVLGFEVGTDDYVVKPFSPRELVHRVRALARRAQGTAPAEERAAVLRWRDLALDPQSHRVTCGPRALNLRPLEFRLLQLFLENPDEVLTRSKLLQKAWGVSAQINTRTVDTHVRRLREALDGYADAIETVHGVGYRLRRDDP